MFLCLKMELNVYEYKTKCLGGQKAVTKKTQRSNKKYIDVRKIQIINHSLLGSLWFKSMNYNDTKRTRKNRLKNWKS